MLREINKFGGKYYIRHRYRKNLWVYLILFFASFSTRSYFLALKNIFNLDKIREKRVSGIRVISRFHVKNPLET